MKFTHLKGVKTVLLIRDATEMTLIEADDGDRGRCLFWRGGLIF